MIMYDRRCVETVWGDSAGPEEEVSSGYGIEMNARRMSQRVPGYLVLFHQHFWALAQTARPAIHFGLAC